MAESRGFSMSEDDMASFGPERMMLEFEDARQMEFDFDAPVLDEKAFRAALASAVAGYKARKPDFAEGLSQAESWSCEPFGDGFAVRHRYTMIDPLDSQFYNDHSDFLESLRAGLPENV